jgi:alpha-amylase/alpha-mannosidase (GH57 family)
MERFICIHGHFYQPPRENPWLESVELQDSAAAYHDWNERITAECYEPNTAARILDPNGRIERIANNYARISFNFGPTLLAWMKFQMPEVHAAIVEADKQSRSLYSGHGSALAQVYSHMILPLANRNDKYTQVLWGIRDFEHRFGRSPEGMWLAETAADIETLDVLAELGIQFTILSPFQASRVREIGKRHWRDVNGARIDPTRPYLAHLPSGRTINLFFYDGPVSQAVAFENLLTSGEKFANRLASAFSDSRKHEQLVHIATDGESYGHHTRYGEMALAYALQYIEAKGLARLTNYGEFLEKHPPTHEVRIHEKSAWSCSHGVGRWMADCGCNSGGRAEWNQSWRAPLREALDWLRDEMAPVWEEKGRELLRDPWHARNEYIQIVLDRSRESLDGFFAKHSLQPTDPAQRTAILKLMELQRHAMLMYTSCGWFFDEVSGIETVQVIQYAARSIQLAREVFQRDDLESAFLERLERAKSNIPEHCDGRCIYEKFVKPAMIDWEKAVAHYAVSSIFRAYTERTKIYVFRFDEEHRRMLTSGKAKLAVGRTRVTSEITQESAELCYAVLYLGEHNLTGGVSPSQNEQDYQAMFDELKAAFERADFPQTIRLIDRHFGHSAYSLKSLFRDEQRRIVNEIVDTTREDLENRYRLIAERYTPLIQFLADIRAPFPAGIQTALDFVLHVDLLRQFDSNEIELAQLQDLLQKAQNGRPHVLDSELSHRIKLWMEQMIQRIPGDPLDVAALKMLDGVAALVVPLPLGLNLAKVQNRYWELLHSTVPAMHDRMKSGDGTAEQWLKLFLSLGEHLQFANRSEAVANNQ